MLQDPYSIDEIESRERELLVEMKRLSDNLKEAPRRMVELQNTLEPPEDIRRERQRRKIHAAVTKQQVHNTRRELRENTLMLVLLIACIGVSFFWILNLLHAS